MISRSEKNVATIGPSLVLYADEKIGQTYYLLYLHDVYVLL